MASQPEVDGERKVLVQGDITQNEGQSSLGPLNGHLNDALLDLDPFSKGHSSPDVVSENGLPSDVPLSSQNGTTTGDQLLDLGGSSLKPDLLEAKMEVGAPAPPMQNAFMTSAPEGSEIPPPNIAPSDLGSLQGQQVNDLNLVDLDLQPPPPQTDAVSNGNSIDLLADLVAHPPNGPADLPTAPPLEDTTGLAPVQPEPIQPEPVVETHKDEPLVPTDVSSQSEPVQETLVQPESSQAVEASPPVPPLDLMASGDAVPPVSQIPQAQSPKKSSPKKAIPSPTKKSPTVKPTTPKSPKATTPKTTAPSVDASRIPSPKKERTASAAASAKAKVEVKKTPSKPAERKTPTRPVAGPLRAASAKKDGVDSGIEDDKKETPNSARAIKKPTPLKAASSPRTPRPLPSSKTSTSSRSSTETPGSPSPNTRNARSKVGSLNNAKHIPGGGDKKIESVKVEWNAQSKVGSMKNATYKPGGGEKKIESAKLEWKQSSKTDTGKNAPPPSKRAEKKIESRKLEWKAESKVGSMNNVTHKPTGGEKKIDTQKLEWKANSKVGSMDNATHKPLGGDKKIETVKLDWKAESKVGSKDNLKHQPGGGEVQIESHKLEFKEKAIARTSHQNSPGRSPRMSETSSVSSDK